MPANHDLAEGADQAGEDFDLFGDDVAGLDDSIEIRRGLRQRAERMRLEKLARLPPPSQRSCAQNRTAYVLSGSRLQPRILSGVLAVGECEAVLAAVVDYVDRQGALQTARHERFATTDVPVSDLRLAVTTPSRAGGGPAKTVGQSVLEWVSARVLSVMAEATGFRTQDLGLKDLFVVCYSGTKAHAHLDVKKYPIFSKQASLDVHSDGCLLSFSLLLNHQDAFEGGGTFFKATGNTFRLEQGSLLMHDAGLEHAGAEIISGQRIILVGFVDTVDVLREKLAWEKKSTRRLES